MTTTVDAQPVFQDCLRGLIMVLIWKDICVMLRQSQLSEFDSQFLLLYCALFNRSTYYIVNMQSIADKFRYDSQTLRQLPFETRL